MDCREKFPGQILLTPLFPDGRGELIDILLPGLECEVKSYFLPEDLDLRGIKRNKNPVECIKPQKSKPGPSQAQPTKPTEYWYSIPPGIHSLAIAFPEYTGYTRDTMDWEASIWRRGPYRIETAVVYYAGISLRENEKLLVKETEHTDAFGYSFNVSLHVRSGSEDPLRPFANEIYYHATNDPMWAFAVIYQPHSFPFGYRIRTWRGVSPPPIYKIFINGEEIGSQMVESINPHNNSGDNGMKEDCCDCIEAMAALMEAYMEKVEKLIKESEARIKEHINDTAYRQCVFFQEQLKAFDITDDDRVIERIDKLENNIWTGGELTPLNINSENK